MINLFLVFGVIMMIFQGVYGIYCIYLTGEVLKSVLAMISGMQLPLVLIGISKIMELLEKHVNSHNMSVKEHLNNSIMTDKDILDNGGWRCKKCGKINASYVGTCGCGEKNK